MLVLVLLVYASFFIPLNKGDIWKRPASVVHGFFLDERITFGSVYRLLSRNGQRAKAMSTNSRKRKPLLDVSNEGDVTARKRANTSYTSKVVESTCSCTDASCELSAFVAFVTEHIASKQYPDNRRLRNAAYYGFSTRVRGVYGKGKQYRIPECCKIWLRKRFPDENSQFAEGAENNNDLQHIYSTKNQ